MKIAFNRKVRRTPWGGGAHFHSAMVDILEERGHTVTNQLTPDIDVIFMLDPRYEENGFDWEAIKNHKKGNVGVKVLHRVNECDARNGGTNKIDQLLVRANAVADHTVFISNWLRDHLVFSGLSPDSKEVIYNGCRLDWFYPEENHPKMLANLDRKIRLVTHHWSDNPLKGFDVYNALDRYVEKYPQYEFTYIGRYDKNYLPKNTRVLPPMYGPALGDELRKHDIYVTASRNEPAGMHHVEGAASGLPVLYHAHGGGILECASKHGLPFDNAATFHVSLTDLVKDYNHLRESIDYESLSLRLCCERYYAAILKLVDQ